MFLENMDKERFNSFIDNHYLGHFLQTSEWGEFKSLHEWNMHRVGFEKNGEIVACSLLLSRNIPGLNKKILYAPRGFVLNYGDKDILKQFTESIKKFGKKIGAIFVRIDPYVKRIDRDLDGKVIEGGLNNNYIIESLTDLDFIHKGFDLNFDGVQPRFSMRLDITDNIENVFKSFHSKTRYNIRVAERKGIEILEGNKEDLKRFEEIMRVTGDRDGFITRPLSYFNEMYDILVPKNRMKLFLAKFNIDKGIENLKEELLTEKSNLDRYREQLKESDDENKTDKLNNKIDNSLKRIEKLEEEVSNLEKEKIENPEGIIISGTILMLTGDKAWYLYGASDNSYRNLMPNHLIQWEMIKYSKEQGCSLYDFRGISGDLSEDNHLYGLYKFKKGFNPEFTEYIGEFDLILNKTLYYAWEVMIPKFKKIRRKFIKRR